MSENGAASNLLIKAENVSRTFKVGAREVHALRGISLEIERGKLVSMRGRSGSGKTTLLNCIGGLDRPTEGRIWIEGKSVEKLAGKQQVQLRRKKIGFIFQAFSLMPAYSAAENIDLMLRLAGYPRGDRHKRVAEVLGMVGLTKWSDHRPFEMSGGQQQRVAIARAIAPRPILLLADEPTGELDTNTGNTILELLRQIVDREKMTMLIATHDLTVDTFADEVVVLQDGQIISRETTQISHPLPV